MDRRARFALGRRASLIESISAPGAEPSVAAADIGWYRGAMAGRRGVNERTSIQRRLERDCPEDTGRLYCDWLLRIATGATELQLHELPHA
jgi:hypothetical protein